MAKLEPYKKYKTIEYDYMSHLPEDWQLLPNIAIFQERIERGNENEELLSVTIGKGVIKQSELEKKDSSTLDKSKYLLVYSGDLVYSMRFRQGASGYSNYKGIVSPACTVLKPQRKLKYNPRYYHYMFRTGFYQNYVERFSYGIADGQIPLRYTNFKRMYSIVPPLETQNKIVEYLDKKSAAIDKFIRNKERLIDLLEEQRREMIDNFLNLNQEIQSNNLPLKYLVRIISEQSKLLLEGEKYLALENIESWTGKIYLSIGNNEFESSVKKFKDSDVLFNKLRPYLAKVVIPDFNGVCVNELLVLRPTKKILKEFLFYKLISKRFIDYVDSSTYGSKMPRANYDFIGKIRIEYPIEIRLQSQIVKEIKIKELQIENLKNKYMNEIKSIQEYRNTLVSDLVTGKRSIPE